jgi:D-alanyl-D-alanine carboxypeptidase
VGVRRILAPLLVTTILIAAAPVASASRPPEGAATMQAASRPAYFVRITPLPDGIRRWMNGVSWRPGCPVPLRDLRLLRLRFWGFDRTAHRGRLVVHRDVAWKIAQVFRRLYAVSFPIRRMRLVDYYGADDRTSMEHDNTSAFNCRWRAGQPGVWSQHAYGRAIDVNPRENPYVWSGGFSPPNAGAYVDRSNRRKGMIFHADAVWWAFRNRGWEWGGNWSDVKDYQHFSRNGR